MTAVATLEPPAARRPGWTARKPHAERRAEIIEAALDLAAEGGVGRVTSQAIADRLGIAQATVFRHFARCEDIFRAAMEHIGELVFAELGPVFAEPGAADRRLRAVIAAHLRFIATRRGIPRLLFSDRLHLDDCELKAAARRVVKRYTGALAGLLAQGAAEKCFRADLDPVGTAGLIVALVQGTVLRWSMADFAFPLDAQAEPLWRFIEPHLKTS